VASPYPVGATGTDELLHGVVVRVDRGVVTVDLDRPDDPPLRRPDRFGSPPDPDQDQDQDPDPGPTGAASRRPVPPAPSVPGVPAGAVRTVRAGWGGGLLIAVHRDPDAAPVTGDRVRLRQWPDARITVEAVVARRSLLSRAEAGGSSRRQNLAANVDVVAVVEGLAPDPDRNRILRLLALARAGGLEPVVILTKADLEPEAARIATDLEPLVDCPVLAVSAARRSGLESVRALFAGGRTVVLLGASGVGKSSLANALLDDDLMRVRAVRRDGRGRHTTVTRELHPVAGGHLIDGPGLRSIGLDTAEGLSATFADITGLAADCRFGDCGHLREPGCAVLAAVEEGILSPDRLDSYRRLAAEGTRQEIRRDARLRQEHERRDRIRSKEYRRPYRRPPESGHR